MQEFRVLGPGEQPLDLDDVGDRVAEAIAAVYRGDAESDPLNRLVITAGLDRCAGRDPARLPQVPPADRLALHRGLPERRAGGELADHGQARALLRAALRPRHRARRGRPRRALRDEILADLEDVTSIDHDRILRNQLGAIDATLRTSAYKEGRGATAFKLRSADVPAIPMPSPEFEIYVYAPEMEGIHLRGGAIARGGIRFSDRMDYRTEVYGLMRAQLTKNAIIVPGRRQGRLHRQAHADRQGDDPGVATSPTSGRCSTSPTTSSTARSCTPSGVRVRDDDDTYLVVAADKGTATFSDTANAVAREYGFWLDDAFASGGSVGYDHKKLGITARGAWESVKRHFRELGMDPRARRVHGGRDRRHVRRRVRQRDAAVATRSSCSPPTTTGTCSSTRIPDPARVVRRAQAAVRDAGLLVGGLLARGAVRGRRGLPARRQVDRAARTAARELLGLDEGRVAPNEVIRAILRAQVDLLWNGGIGTVVKASTESDADAADRASDAIRVDARELRCRVVGEGGNLGFTRRARVEYSAGGGRINADFIDNSAGVDCSDHEVNLKILLGLAERHGEMTRAERDELLEAVTEDVVEHVLYDSFLQAQIIAQEVGRSPGAPVRLRGPR